jgi:hypothetical protein
MSCEEVVDVDLNTEDPRLVIEAPIAWLKGSSGNIQTVKLSTTTSFYSDEIPTVSGASVSIKNSSGDQFDFIEGTTAGLYICTSFVPVLEETYTLTVIVDGVTYSGSEVLQAVAPIDELTQINDGGITKDEIQIKTYFIDPANEDNYYLFQYAYNNATEQNLTTSDDSFFQGNRFFSLSQNDELAAGDVVTVTHYGISKTYYNYLSILITVSGESSGGPFETPPATVRGNMINITDADNYPLGFFSLSETDSRTYTIQ